MNTMIWLVAAISLPVFVFSQTASEQAGCAPLGVSFTAPTGSSTWFWDFQDGSTSALQQPVHTFTNPGSYLVAFSESPGGPVLGTIPIEIYAKPNPEISADPTFGCTPLSVSFENNTSIPGGINVTGVEWVFGDGGSSTAGQPVYVYQNAGLFTVSLSLTTNYQSCDITEIFPSIIQATAPPTASFTTDPAVLASCEPPLTASITNNSSGTGPLTFQWDFGNGQTSNEASPAAQTYLSAGSFAIQLTVTDTNDCIGQYSQGVSIGEPVASFFVADTLCIFNQYPLQSNVIAGSYTWTFGPSGVPSVSNLPNPIVAFQSEGFTSITLTISNGQCSDDTTRIVYVDQLNAGFTSAPSYTCYQPIDIAYDPVSDEPVSWTWVFSDGSVSFEENPVQHWVDEDTTQYTENGPIFDMTYLTVYNSVGCFATFSAIDTIWYPNARFMPDITSGCAPLSVIFSDSSTSKENIISWQYDFGDGNTAMSNFGSPVGHTYDLPGEYLVSLIIENSGGCIDTSYFVLIEVGDTVSLAFEADQTEICPGDTVHFTALNVPPEIDAWHYYTDEGRSFHCFQDPHPGIVFGAAAGTYDVTLSAEYNGCYSETTLADYIQVNGPVAQIGYEIDCASPFYVSFEALGSGATSWSWDFGDGSFSNAASPSHTYLATSDYQVVLTANSNSGCPASTDTVEIHIRTPQAQFELDDHLCNAQTYALDASPSIDPYVQCFKGYTWYFSYEPQRPITTADTITDFAFISDGPQTVSLVIEDINGCRDTLTRWITVYNIDAQLAVDDDQICIPSAVQFTDLSVSDTTITAWDWEFGDGNNSTSQHPLHEYLTSGLDTIWVILQAQNIIGCTDVDTFPIAVYAPVSVIVSNPGIATLCTDEPISFFATDFNGGGSSLAWSWDLGNGQTAAGQSVQNAAYSDEGNYSVSLYFTEIATGCTDTVTRIIQVQSYPDAQFSTNVDNLPVICYPQNVFFANETESNFQLSFQWDFGNGQFSTAPNPATVYDKGNYTTTLIVSTPYGCADTVSQSFVVVGPEGNFIMSTNQICRGDTILFTLIDTLDVGSFQWDFGDGTVISNVNPVSHIFPFYPPSGQTVAKLILAGENGSCTQVVELPIQFYQVEADFIRNDGLDTSLCFGIPYPFENASVGANIFQWDFGDGITSNQEDPSHLYPEPGAYPVQLIAINATWGCIDTITYIAIVDESLQISTTGDEICPGDTAYVSIQDPLPGWQAVWTPAGQMLDPNATTTGVIVSATDTVSVSVIDAMGCQGSADAVIVVYEPYLAADWDTVIASGGSAVLPFAYDPLYQFDWSPAAGLSCTDCSMPEVSPEETTVYTLTATDPIGCSSTVVEFTVIVYKEEVDIPNAFSPNGDGINDAFNVIIQHDLPSELYEIHTFDIFNRWGEKIYENGNPAVGWNGDNRNGKPQPTDVYIFVVEVVFFSGKKEVLKGDVTLIR